MEIDLKKVSAYLADNATCMTRNSKEVLRSLKLDSMHVNCNTRTVNLTTDQWRIQLSELLNKFTGCLKKLFKHCPTRKHQSSLRKICIKIYIVFVQLLGSSNGNKQTNYS